MDKLHFLFKSFFIVSKEGSKYLFSRNYTEAIKNVSLQLAKENIFYVKIFQSMSTNENLLNDDLMKFLTEYTDNVPYSNDEIDIDTLKELEYESRGTNNEIIIKSYTPINSGMISLVFEGTMNAKHVIIKVLRKNIIEKIHDAFNKMDFLIRSISFWPYIKNFNIVDIFNENRDTILDQIDFNLEVENIETFYNIWKDIPYIKIPQVYPQFTKMNKNVIVMEYMDGLKLKELNPEDKDEYSYLLAKFNFKSMFFDGIYHGDLHQGNILFMKEDNQHQIGIIDMGIVGKMTREEQNDYFAFFNNIVEKDYKTIADKGLITMVEPKEVIDNLREEQIDEMKKKIMDVMEIACVVNKKMGAEEIYMLNKTLRDYGLQLKKGFCKMELSLAITDSVCRDLATDVGYVENLERAFKELFPSDILDY